MTVELETTSSSNEYQNYSRNAFFTLLQNLDTSIPINNIFGVDFLLPSEVSNESHALLGESAKADANSGIKSSIEIFLNPNVSNEIHGVMLCSGFSTPGETIEVGKTGKTINGYLPITYTNMRQTSTTDLSIDLIETSISIADFVFRPWIKLVARHGGFSDSGLHTNITINCFDRNSQAGYPAIRKQFTFFNCLPFELGSEGKITWSTSFELVKREIKWRFDRYEIKVPETEKPPAEEAPENPTPKDPGYEELHGISPLQPQDIEGPPAPTEEERQLESDIAQIENPLAGIAP